MLSEEYKELILKIILISVVMEKTVELMKTGIITMDHFGNFGTIKG